MGITDMYATRNCNCCTLWL